MAAARVLYPDATITGVTALRQLGASIGADSPIYLAARSRVRREGITVVPTASNGDGGTATVAEALTVAKLGLVSEVVTLDELHRLRKIRRSDEAELAERRAESWHLCVADSGSNRESRTRMMLHTAGLPVPRTQYRVLDEVGRLVGRVDLAWPEFTVIVEYEGQQHLTNSEQWEKDIRRYEELRRLGWNVIRVTAATLRDPVALALRVDAALRSGGWRGRSLTLDAAWLAKIA